MQADLERNFLINPHIIAINYSTINHGLGIITFDWHVLLMSMARPLGAQNLLNHSVALLIYLDHY